jgi:hypothetical protein
MRIKLLGAAVTLTGTPSIIYQDATDFLVVHDAGGNTMRVITLYENDGITVVGSFYSNPASQFVVHKKAGQKFAVASGSDIHVTPVGYLS